MSREILKRVVQCLHTTGWTVTDDALVDDIKTYLAQPEPEPVAWIGEGLIVRSSDDVEILRQHEPGLASLYNTPIYTSPPDQSARVAELEKQLAALQAKRDPLSELEISSLWQKSCASKEYTLYAFARAIEAAHGIGGE